MFVCFSHGKAMGANDNSSMVGRIFDSSGLIHPGF